MKSSSFNKTNSAMHSKLSGVNCDGRTMISVIDYEVEGGTVAEAEKLVESVEADVLDGEVRSVRVSGLEPPDFNATHTQWPENGLDITLARDGITVAWECRVDVRGLACWAEQAMQQRNAESEALGAFADRHGDRISLGTQVAAVTCDYLRKNADGILTPTIANFAIYDALALVRREGRRLVRAAWAPDYGNLIGDARASNAPQPTGIDSLDSVMGGGWHKGLSYVTGEGASGKTALAVTSALFAARHCSGSACVAYIMLDGTAGDIATRMASLSHALISIADGKAPEGCSIDQVWAWTDDELRNATQALDRVAGDNIVLLDGENDFDSLMGRLDAMVRQGMRPRLVVVDYLQLLRVGGSVVGYDGELTSAVAERLRSWARRNECAVVALSTLTKEAQNRRNGVVTLADLSGGSSLAYSAEAILHLRNPHDGSGMVEVTDLKGRHAGNQSQDQRRRVLALDATHGLFTDVSDIDA